MSDSNTTYLAFQRETAWGVTPVPCGLRAVRMTKEGFNHEKFTVRSANIRADRQRDEMAEVGVEAKGTFDFELSVGDLDELFEGAFFSAFALVGAVPTLTNGVTRRSYLFEKKLTSAAFFSFAGMMIDQLTLTLTSRQIITGQLSFLGKQGASSANTLDTSGSVTDPANGLLLTASAHVANVLEGGVAFASAKSLSLTFNNNLRANDVIGQKAPEEIGIGSFAVSGKMEAYFRDRTLVEKFINHTETSVSFEVSREAAGAVVGDHIGYRITIPSIRLTKDIPAIPGVDADVMIPIEFEANATGGVKAFGTLTLTANPANNETVVVGGKTYTFKTVLTNTDGFVFIGATASDSIDNLIAAITLSGGAGTGAGTLYAAATTLHPSVSAAAGAGDTMTVTALNVGEAGNAIATTETLANGGSQFGAATLGGGVNSVTAKIEKLLKA